jgi:ketosteroid isomerase-like protein
MTLNSRHTAGRDDTGAASDRIAELLKRNLLDVFDERDGVRRRAAIAELWTPDAVFVDPEGRFVGHDAVDAVVAKLQESTPGWVFTATGSALTHPGGGELSWAYGPADAPTRITGTDVAVVRDDRIVALYTVINTGPPPAESAAPDTATRDTVLAFFGHLGEGAPDRALALLAEQVDWLIPGNASLPWIGHRSSPAEVAEVLTILGGLHVPGESISETRQVLVDGPDAVVLGRIAHTVKSTGRHYDMLVAFHLTVLDGRITRLHMYEDTYLVSQAFSTTP